MESKSQVISGHREKFIRLDSMDPRSPEAGLNRCTINIQRPKRFTQANKTSSGSFKKGFRKGSEGLWSIGRSIGLGVSRAVFPEDLEVSEKKIFDPQDKFLLLCNKLFVASCILAVSVDPLFLFLPFINDKAKCVGIDRKLAIVTTTLRTVIDSFYLFHMALRFRTAYVAPSSRVFGRGELVIDPAQIAKRYLQQYFIIDLLSVLPVPQIIVWRFLYSSRGANVLATKQALRYIVLVQYIPRFLRMYPLSSELKRTAGVFAETAWAGAAYYLLLYMLASHIVGALWYLLALERNNDCWSKACKDNDNCTRNFLFCGNQNMKGYDAWDDVKDPFLQLRCPVNVTEGEEPPFDFGIYLRALSSGIVSSKKFVSKYFFCLWWGLQNLSTLGQGLETSTYPGEVIFSIVLAIAGLLLFALLIGNMQTYLQSLTIRLEEMRVKRRDSEQWMHHRMLPPELRERVRRYDQYKWLETRGVDEENLVSNLPKDLRRDIKRHLCLALVRRVPLFENMDERLLDAICERLKPCLYTEKSFLVREGDPVNEMLFIIRGRLESVTTDGGRSGFYNRSLLKEGDFCGDELLTWALDPKSGSNLPSSTRTVKALTEVEAFALIADELKFVASQFRRLHSRQVQHTFRFYSQQWRTWAACFIQAAWRRYTKRKKLEELRKEEEMEEESSTARLIAGGSSPFSIRATFLASRFAANALRGVRKNRTAKLLKSFHPNLSDEVDFEFYLRIYLKLQAHVNAIIGSGAKNSSAFLKAATTTLLHTISDSEKSSYVAHINNYLSGDEFLNKYLPINPSSNDLFEVVKDGVLLCKLINVAVPGTIDERAINTKSMLNPWERNENHTLCLNSAKAIGCTVVNIGTQDIIEGRRHLVLGVISQIIKIQLLADLNLKKTPQLVELVDDSKDVEELMSLPPDKILLRWMNFQLRKTEYKKTVTNFSSDVKDAEAYTNLLNVLAPEHKSPSKLAAKNPFERAKNVLEHADRMGCRRYLTAKDIVEGSPNLNLAFVAHIFQHRNGLSTKTKQISFLADDTQISREEKAFRFWINSFDSSMYINNVFEDLRDGWILLQTLDKVSPGIVNWKIASKPPIKLPFKKVENCNQVVKLGKQLKFSLVNIAGNDIVQGNKKLILAYLWQLMRYNILQLLKNLRSHSNGKEITDVDILEWANAKVRKNGSQTRMFSFRDKSLSDGIFFLELLSSVQPRVVNWSLVTNGVTDEEKKMNATYVISIARKMGCSIFLLPEDITEVNQKMILTLTASIMHWTLKEPLHLIKPTGSPDSHNGSSLLDDSTSDSSLE